MPDEQLTGLPEVWARMTLHRTDIDNLSSRLAVVEEDRAGAEFAAMIEDRFDRGETAIVEASRRIDSINGVVTSWAADIQSVRNLVQTVQTLNDALNRQAELIARQGQRLEGAIHRVSNLEQLSGLPTYPKPSRVVVPMDSGTHIPSAWDNTTRDHHSKIADLERAINEWRKTCDQKDTVIDSLRRDLEGTSSQLQRERETVEFMRKSQSDMINQVARLRDDNMRLADSLEAARRDLRIMDAHASGDYSILTEDDKRHLDAEIKDGDADIPS